ncbi:hypothetical protein D9M69_439830 [compost metagenome]
MNAFYAGAEFAKRAASPANASATAEAKAEAVLNGLPEGTAVDSIRYWAEAYATGMGGGHAMVVKLLHEYAALREALAAAKKGAAT